MRKLIAPLGLVCALLAATVLVAAPASKAPDKTSIDDCVVKRTAVAFPHGEHAKTLACDTCHHTQKGLKAGEATEVQACASCHTTPEKAETPKCSEMSTAKNHFHIGCVNCHKEELAKKADTKAPTKCDECHPKA